MPPKPRPIAERFWEKVDKSGECWLWMGARRKGGYGNFRISKADSTSAAHRVAYNLLVGPIPAGLTIDHLCRNPPCVNPAHFELVTRGENARRGNLARPPGPLRDECAKGHPLTPENVRVWAGRRHCRACRMLRTHQRHVADGWECSCGERAQEFISELMGAAHV